MSASESFTNFVAILQESVFQEKRIIFIKNLTLLNSIIRRVKKSNKLNGVLQQSRSAENSNSINSINSEYENQHPAYDAVCPVLPIILKLVKTIHSLLDESSLSFLMDLSDQEKSHILGIHFSGGNAQTAAGEPIPSSIAGNILTESEKTHSEKLKVTNYLCIT